jgi:two-component system phosphate regulon response regulator PhoB
MAVTSSAGRLPTPGRLYTVLVVDEDAAARRHLSNALRRVGYSTREASSGVEALAATREKRPDAVVLDVALPGVTGYAVCQTLREEFGEGLPIIFVSGKRTKPLDRVAGLLLGADDYVVRPYVVEELVARVRRSVERAKSARKVRPGFVAGT